MRWTREQVVEHLSPPPGISMPPYPRARDQMYRMTLAALALGLSGEAVGVLSGRAWLATVAHGFIAAAVLAASLTFLVWLSNWRHTVRALAALGLILWLFWPIAGWAASLGAASIMAAKETHCFHFPAGRVIPWYSLALGIALIFGHAHPHVIGVGWAVLALLWWWLALDRRRLPLFEI